MNYRQILPPKDLRQYIRYFGLLEDNTIYKEPKTFKIIADGCPGLIFQEDPDRFFDKNKKRLPQLFLHGLTTTHSEKTTKGHYCNLGIYFQPNALKSVFGIDANELTNQYAELSSIIKNDLGEQLLEQRSTKERVDILSNFVQRQLVKNKQNNNQKLALALYKLQTENTETVLSEIQTDLNLSERSLERIFKTSIGVSPKLCLRINRFQKALNCIRKQSFQSLTEVAYQHAYADQSHYIREFKEFSGVSPKQFLLHTNEQAINFPEWKK